jgi:hypothetical protein
MPFPVIYNMQKLLTTFWKGFLMSKSEENKVILIIKKILSYGYGKDQWNCYCEN